MSKIYMGSRNKDYIIELECTNMALKLNNLVSYEFSPFPKYKITTTELRYVRRLDITDEFIQILYSDFKNSKIPILDKDLYIDIDFENREFNIHDKPGEHYVYKLIKEII